MFFWTKKFISQSEKGPPVGWSQGDGNYDKSAGNQASVKLLSRRGLHNKQKLNLDMKVPKYQKYSLIVNSA